MSNVSQLPKTTWANPEANHFTGKASLKEVPIPMLAKPKRGSTKYDAEFEKLLKLKVAYEVPQSSRDSIRRGLQRFFEFRGLDQEYMFRQMTNKRLETVTFWIEKRNDYVRK